jgi:hypothetical protein
MRDLRVNKVFGIGLSKTATRSLARAMRMLGYRTLHKGDDATSAKVHLAADRGIPPLGFIGSQFDAYFDVEAVVVRFKELDPWYPGSKFILTTRDVDGWVDSREKHVRANQHRAARGEYKGSWLTVDREGWRAERDAHHAAVSGYFADRPDDLLVMDVVGGDGWDVLCPFLGRPVPGEPFPWENRDGAGTYGQALGVLQQVRRRAGSVARRLRR